ncbi:MAG: YdcF family protein [Minisyncoccia bacterium]|jgi:uncharacterized SAM-binding protein YcdF (DUF218 family)
MTIREKFIALVDNDCLKKSDAIILLEGDGTNRCAKAVELYKSGMAETVVFSGGADDRSYGSFPFEEVGPVLLGGGIPSEAIIREGKSRNTQEQAVEVVAMARARGWKKLLLVGSHYHQYRAYLTFLRSVLDAQDDIVLYNAPARDLPWFLETGWGKRFDLLDQEFDRIEKYSAMSHLATFEEAINYQKWKEQQV